MTLCDCSSTKELQFTIRAIYEDHKEVIQHASESPGGVVKRCMKKTCYHYQGTCVIDKEKFLADLQESVRKKEWGRIKTMMIGWEKMLENDFKNYQKNLKYEQEQKEEFDKEVRQAFYQWKTMEHCKHTSMLIAEGGRDDLPDTLKERFDKWVSKKVFVFKGQRFCGRESWGIFDSDNI
jgi:hypothetical protein